MENAFDHLQEEFIDACLKRHPQEASHLGFTRYDSQLPSGKLHDRQKGIEQDKEFLERFQDIDPEKLDFDRRITRKLAIHKLNIWIFVDETLQHYMMDPNASNEVASALNSLFIRSGHERFYPLHLRLEKTPQYIQDFKTRVVKPTKLWTEMAIEGAEGLLKFLPQIVAAAREEIPSQDAEALEDAAKKVEKSLLNYISYLNEILPTATTPWVMGRENFETLLTLRLIPYSGDQILALGKKWLQGEKMRLKELANSFAPGKSVQEVARMAKSQHPSTFKGILELYKTYIKKSRDFIIANDIVTMPEGEKLEVKETPEYIRYQLPFAAYLSAPAVGSERVGYYLVTPPESEDFFSEHNEPAIANVSVHEAYPGHHIQIFCSNNHPHKIRWTSVPSDVYVKYVSEGTELVEGWAHYCEEYMQKKGYCTSREYLFIQSLQVLWRAIRIIVDVQLSRGEMSFEEAVSFMKKETKMENFAAVAEVKRYTLGPTYPLSYLLGKHMVKDLKKKVKKMMGSQFTDKFFHDTVVYEGTMPLALLEEIFKHKAQSG
ncbi:MAG: hypothetical protein AYK18_09415 [Theionarchaea archaeon DG-70]|nr:MAG: hypothetical protein AYK18_09415 [Theionarchaea archaeon DG-70]